MNLILEIFHIILIFSSLCVKYTQEKVSPHENTKRIFLSLSSLCGFSPWGRSYWILIWDIFRFFSLSLFSLCVRFLAIFVDVWSSWPEEHICWYNALYINRFSLIYRAVETARKVSKHILRIRRKYLSVDGEYGKVGLFAVHKIVSYARKVFKHIRRIRGKDLCVHGDDAKRVLAYSPTTPRDIKVCISSLILIQI